MPLCELRSSFSSSHRPQFIQINPMKKKREREKKIVKMLSHHRHRMDDSKMMSSLFH